jgi:hypothetical protein
MVQSQDVRREILLCALAGCGFHGQGVLSPSDGDIGTDAAPAIDAARPPPVDAAGDGPSAMIDAMPQMADAPAACLAWTPHPRHFDPCAIGVSSTALDLAASGKYVFDTSTNTLVDPGGATIAITAMTLPQTTAPMVSILDTGSFHIAGAATLRVIGTNPLIIASWSTLVIDGTIDVSSNAGGLGGGANTGACTAAQPGADDALNSGGSGGGGGGALRGNGGKGGPGDSPTQNPGGNGGAFVALPHVVRGGCAGAASGKAGGGDPANPTVTSPGGAGGGGLQLTARTSITITGKLHAGGQGGGGAVNGSANGGGGGGSGGYLGIEAPMIMVPGTLAANGGGGGGSNVFGGTGAPGGDATANATAAPGGAASSCSLAGASGSAGVSLDGATACTTIETCGGAGGGGGAGFVLIFSNQSSGTGIFSPAFQLNPF